MKKSYVPLLMLICVAVAAAVFVQRTRSNHPIPDAGNLESTGQPVTRRADPKTSQLLHQLETAVIARSPIMAQRMQPGLTESEIRAELKKAEVPGDIEVLVQLYSWRNGTEMGKNDTLEAVGLFPKSIERSLDLKSSIGQWQALKQASGFLRWLPGQTKIDRAFFPIMADDGGGAIAVDLTPSKNNRVMIIDPEVFGKPVEAYPSFQAFIQDAVRANKEGNELKVFRKDSPIWTQEN